MLREPAVLPKRTAVLGGGVMGRQIAALLVGAGVEVDLLDLGTADDPAGLAREAVASLSQMRPAPLFRLEDGQHIRPGALHDAEKILGSAEWVIEAVVEDLSIKRSVLDLVEEQVHRNAVISTNTSGLPIASLCEGRSASFCERFIGTHFFNPPRTMQLVELIPGDLTLGAIVERSRDWVEAGLGKRVVVCRDTPNFIANRLGIFSVMDALHRMAESGMTVEAVDAVTGTVIGRPRSATLRLCDLIGIDTLAHVARTVYESISEDPWRETFAPPAFLTSMIDSGHVGAKADGGFYAKRDGTICSRDMTTGQYGPQQRIKMDLPTRGPLVDRLGSLWSSDDPLARFAREHVASTLAYAASCAREVADHLEDVDHAMVWGFNWEVGPMELIDLIGARRVAETLEASSQPVSDLIADLARSGQTVYRREHGAVAVLGYDGAYVAQAGGGSIDDDEYLNDLKILEQSEGARLYDAGQGVGVLQFHAGALNVLGSPSLQCAIDVVGGKHLQSLVLCGAGENLSAGADLKYLLRLIDEQNWGELEQYLILFQAATTTVRYAPFPVVMAARGLALGGGCEFTLSCCARVLAAELRMGLVETKVGLIPGGGGCKEVVRRIGDDVDDMFALLLKGAMSDSARQAQAWGLADEGDMIRLDGHRVVQHAVAKARELSGHHEPPTVADHVTAGATGLQRLISSLTSAHDAGQITAHDVVVGSALANVLCGGGAGVVSEQQLLDLEREQFQTLCAQPATRERIAHMLETGKPLNN